MNRKIKQQPEATQLSFLEFMDGQLNEQRGKLIKLPIDRDDIGGELVSLLTKGLYTNPLDCIREYVQNSVDANATNVTIKITGNSVIIYDDGTGMNLADILEARRFAISPKFFTQHVGFRGIGIYSGFDLCHRLRITSKKSGDTEKHVLIFEFSEMKATLEKVMGERQKGVSSARISITELLSEHTHIMREDSEYPLDMHFTHVELQNISHVHIQDLSNRNEMRKYLLQNLPIDFADEFEYKQQINNHLRTHVPGFNAITVVLESDNIEDEVVTREAIPNLQAPKMEYILSDSGQQIAYYWCCLTKQRERIPSNWQGFTYKVKGFSVGNRHLLQKTFAKETLYSWYTGEIYVIDTQIRPNAERDNFETNEAKRNLDVAVLKEMKKLEKDAETHRERDLAEERLLKYQEEVKLIEIEIQAKINQYDNYSRLDDIYKDLKRQKTKVSPEKRKIAENLFNYVKKVQEPLKNLINTSSLPQESTSDTTPSQSLTPPSPAKNQFDTLPLFDVELPANPRPKKNNENHTNQPLALPSTPAILRPPPKTLMELLKEYHWEMSDEAIILVDIIQSSLQESLNIDSPAYRSLLKTIEVKLLAR